MTDSSSKESSSVDGQAERERLIDDLAFLVIRQHHHDQRAGMTSGPNHNDATPTLNPKEKGGM